MEKSLSLRTTSAVFPSPMAEFPTSIAVFRLGTSIGVSLMPDQGREGLSGQGACLGSKGSASQPTFGACSRPPGNAVASRCVPPFPMGRHAGEVDKTYKTIGNQDLMGLVRGALGGPCGPCARALLMPGSIQCCGFLLGSTVDASPVGLAEKKER